MDHQKLSAAYKFSIILIGSLCFVYAFLNSGEEIFSVSFALLAAFSVIVAPRVSLTLPYSNFSVTFSDAIIFITFLMFNGEAAIILASTEMAATCLYLKSTGVSFGRFMILANSASTAIATTVSYLLLHFFTQTTGISPHSENLMDLAGTLGVLALAQFAVSSTLAALFQAFKENTNPSEIWRRDCVASAMTQIIGAVIAGIFFKLLNDTAIANIGIALAVFALFYMSYRRIIKDIKNSIEKAEKAETDRTEIEKKRAEEAEENLAKVNNLFREQEKISRDLQQSKAALERAVYYDSLTGLPNRKYLIERLELLLALDIDIANKYYVLFLDINRFKNINDSLGHPIGDRLLALVSKRLKNILRDEDTIARLGGDEFAIILNDLSALTEAEHYARRIYRKLTQPYVTEGHKIYIDINLGISPFDSEHKKPEDILRDSDIAMHYAKENDINIGVFNKELRTRFLETVKLESELRFAIKRKELALYYQPVVSLTEGTIVGFEALLRWNHSKFGFISPAQFIPIAEESGLIIPITKWILREACTQLAKWKTSIPGCAHLKVSINISGKHLAVENLPEQVQKSLHESKLDSGSLILEITESSAMENAERAIRIFKKLQELGVVVSIDDFGTGYSSLSYLHRLPFNSLKIDRSFVWEITKENENSQILQTIISLAKNLNLRTVAEGIETVDQLRVLQDLDCDLGQGYLFSKPLPEKEVEPLLLQMPNWLPEHTERAQENDLIQNVSEQNVPAF